MTRLLATARTDVRLQLRNGFYIATAFVLGLWLLLFSQVPTHALDLAWLLPALVSGNLVLSTFYFVAGLVLLEKAEGTLEAQVVTPLRDGEYLLSKVTTLTALSLVENLLLVVIVLGGFDFRLLPLLLGLVLAAALYVLAGFLAVARHDSISEFLLPSVLYTALLELPLVAYLAQWEHWLLYLHPLQAPLELLRAAFTPTLDPARLLYGFLYSAAWLAALFAWSRRDFRRFVVERTGAH